MKDWEPPPRIVPPPDPPPNELGQRMMRFHAENPEVYKILVRLARAYKREKRREGIGHLWEVMRWEMFLRVDSKDGFKLSNNHRAYYARLIMKQEEDLAGFFDTKRIQYP